MKIINASRDHKGWLTLTVALDETKTITAEVDGAEREVLDPAYVREYVWPKTDMTEEHILKETTTLCQDELDRMVEKPATNLIGLEL